MSKPERQVAGEVGAASAPPTYLSEANSVEAVLSRFENCDNPRLKAVMTSVIRHLHAVVKETEPTFQEWMLAIDFLTRTGQKCDARRQEWILMSDTLGVSMLGDAINHRKPSDATQTTVLGPFHVADAPLKAMGDTINIDGKGPPLVMSGHVFDRQGKPIDGAMLDIWQSNEEGFYDVQQPGIQPEMNLRGRFKTGPDGRFWFRSARPRHYPVPTDGPVGQLLKALGRHPYRPAHIHFLITAPGYEPLVTHLFMRGDPYLASDAVFGVKEELIIDFAEQDNAAEAAKLGVGNPFFTATYDFVLA
jgi:protocatechuate 3,4-dioxygenase beta subunit